ncbi:hypothetical protein CMO90_02870 [Candidatus Woesearchaeota archaeon]|nr:hypothetical protein [Candidatus Woesearchaeota archaeon]|tara:strand:+ start:155 stop:1153 length:999 start_codon:yes stop_codon:yes gene_type:complete
MVREGKKRSVLGRNIVYGAGGLAAATFLLFEAGIYENKLDVVEEEKQEIVNDITEVAENHGLEVKEVNNHKVVLGSIDNYVAKVDTQYKEIADEFTNVLNDLSNFSKEKNLKINDSFDVNEVLEGIDTRLSSVESEKNSLETKLNDLSSGELFFYSSLEANKEKFIYSKETNSNIYGKFTILRVRELKSGEKQLSDKDLRNIGSYLNGLELPSIERDWAGIQRNELLQYSNGEKAFYLTKLGTRHMNELTGYSVDELNVFESILENNTDTNPNNNSALYFFRLRNIETGVSQNRVVGYEPGFKEQANEEETDFVTFNRSNIMQKINDWGNEK